MSSRLAPLEPPYPEGIEETLASMMPPGVPPLLLFRTLAHNPRVLGKIRAGNLLDRGSLERRSREIVILRTTARCGCEYEWGVHAVAFAPRVGIDAAQLAATARGTADDPAWSARDRLLVRLVDELHDTAQVSDALWEELRREWSVPQLLELLLVAGWYHAISYLANGARVAHEDWAARFAAPPR